jgi:hypothetical protein
MNAKFAQLVSEGRSNIYYASQYKKFKYRSYKAAVFYLSSVVVHVREGADYRLEFFAYFQGKVKYITYRKNTSLYLCVLSNILCGTPRYIQNAYSLFQWYTQILKIQSQLKSPGKVIDLHDQV